MLRLVDNCSESECAAFRRDLLAFCDTLVDAGERTSYLLAAIVDLLIEALEDEGGTADDEKKEALERATKVNAEKASLNT